MTDSEERPDSPATWENVVVGKAKELLGELTHDKELEEEGEEQEEVAHEVREEYEETEERAERRDEPAAGGS